MIRVTVWHENTFEEEWDSVKKVYPQGMGKQISSFLQARGFFARNAYGAEAENGLTEEILKETDVLIWWAHAKHGMVSDEVAARVVRHVQQGMGIIFLHSAHLAKPFKLLMGTSCTLQWREAAERERLWCIEPTHPIAKGVGECLMIPHEEMYGERFDIPAPDETVFLGWFQGGNVFRSGVTYRRGYGKVFYFQPGHETFPIYFMEEIQNIIANAVCWAEPVVRADVLDCPNTVQSLEKID